MGKTMFQCNPVKTSHDDWFTRKSAWSDISQFIPRDKVIWEACMLDSTSFSPIYLQQIGFDVDWNVNENIFTRQKRDHSIIVTNLPFTLKKEIFQHLKTIEQPFIILAPSTCLHTKYFGKKNKDEKIQLIVPSSKRQFDKYVDGKKNEGPDNCSFYTLYICYKAGLDHDVNFI
jgi:hypothetical protein